MEALSRLHLTVTRAYKVNPGINFEVFIHKVDGLSDDHKIEKQRDIHKRSNDDITDAGLELIHLRWATLHGSFNTMYVVDVTSKSSLYIYIYYLYICHLELRLKSLSGSSLPAKESSFC